MDMSTLQPCNGARNAFDVIAKSTAGSLLQPLFSTAIQQQGDFAAYSCSLLASNVAPVPSVAVASQRCGSRFYDR